MSQNSHASNRSVRSQKGSVVDLTADQPDTANTATVASAVRPASYVWLHFVKLKTRDYNKCCVIQPDGNKCGKELKRNDTGSTRSMKAHLESKHGIRDANLPNQSNIIASFKKVKTDHLVSLCFPFLLIKPSCFSFLQFDVGKRKLDATSLMTAVSCFIADCDLPFSIVDRASYRELLTLCNYQVNGMLTKRHSLAQHTRKVY